MLALSDVLESETVRTLGSFFSCTTFAATRATVVLTATRIAVCSAVESLPGVRYFRAKAFLCDEFIWPPCVENHLKFPVGRKN